MSVIAGFGADETVGVSDEFLIGLRFEDGSATDVALSGAPGSLPYMIDQPYMAFMEIKGVKGSTKDMPHPGWVAEVVASVEAPEPSSIKAAQYIAATNPLRRGVRMEPTSVLISYVQKIEEALTQAGIKWDMYPWMTMWGTAPVKEVKESIGDSYVVGKPFVIGVGGGYVDPFATIEDVSAAEGSEEVTEPDTAETKESIPVDMSNKTQTELAEVPMSGSDEFSAWEGLIAVEGVPTGDGRLLHEGSLTWRELPLPIFMMTENPVGGSGHDGAVLVGRIDELERRGTEIWGVGVLDLGSEAGAEANRLLSNKMMRGVSADIDSVEWAVEADSDPLEQMLGGGGSQQIAKGRVMGATLTAFPALAECEVWLADDAPSYGKARSGKAALAEGAEGEDEAMNEAVDESARIVEDDPTCDGFAVVVSGEVVGCFDTIEDAEAAVVAAVETDEPITEGDESAAESDEPVVVASAAFPTRLIWHTPLNDDGALVASAAGGEFPVKPPASWFANPEFDGPAPISVSPEGQIRGHVAVFGSCHIGFPGKCIDVPRSSLGYRGFLRGSTLTAEGIEVRTGPVIADTVHPDLKMSASDAQAFYAYSGCALADVTIGEDRHGIWVAGAMRHDKNDGDARLLRGSDISPDWRTVNGKPREVCALLVVNSSGFKSLVASAGDSDAGDFVMPGRNAAYVADGEVQALVASAQITKQSLLDETIDEVATLRVEFDSLRSQLRPTLANQARLRAQQLAEANQSHPAAKSGSVDELASARKRLARAKAARIANK